MGGGESSFFTTGRGIGASMTGGGVLFHDGERGRSWYEGEGGGEALFSRQGRGGRGYNSFSHGVTIGRLMFWISLSSKLACCKLLLTAVQEVGVVFAFFFFLFHASSR